MRLRGNSHVGSNPTSSAIVRFNENSVFGVIFFDITSRFGIIKKIKGVKYESRVKKVHLNKDKTRVQNV